MDASASNAHFPGPIVAFLQQELARLQRTSQSAHFCALATAVESAYDAAFAAVPTPLDSARDMWIWNTLGVCHRSFLVAASLIGRGHPDDAAGTTRRALEGARVALAVRYNEENWTKWAAYEQRMARWKDRERNVKPKPVSPQLALPQGHQRLEPLGKWLGMLSDALHFTPEFIGNYQPEMRPNKAFLAYFTDDPAELDRALRCLAAVHLLILEFFDEAFGGAFTQSSAWRQAMQAVGDAGTRLCRNASTEPTSD